MRNRLIMEKADGNNNQYTGSQFAGPQPRDLLISNALDRSFVQQRYRYWPIADREPKQNQLECIC